MRRYLGHDFALRMALGAAALGAAVAGCFAWFGSADSYCSEMASVYCRNIFACCTSRQIEAVLGEENVNDEGKCRRDLEISCRDAMAEEIYAVGEGTATFNNQAAAACFDAYNRPDGKCVVLVEKSPFEDVCEESPFEGKQGAGAKCNWDFECVDGTFCDAAVCKAMAKENESCANVRCDDDLYCNAGTCARLKGAGTDCTSTSECAEDLYCDVQCKERQGEGAACTSDAQCASLDCRTGSCSDGSSCSSDANCDGTCTHGGATCFNNSSCSRVCETSGNTCTTANDCNTANSEPCVNDVCLPGTCNGRTCSPKALVEVNYCPLGAMQP